MNLLKIKPMSVNVAYTGRRYKTPAYKVYKAAVLVLLPRNITVPEGLLRVDLEFGLSSELADGDNPIKPFIDICQAGYEFNDKKIKSYGIEVYDVEEGEEYIKFQFSKLDRAGRKGLEDGKAEQISVPDRPEGRKIGYPS